MRYLIRWLLSNFETFKCLKMLFFSSQSSERLLVKGWSSPWQSIFTCNSQRIFYRAEGRLHLEEAGRGLGLKGSCCRHSCCCVVDSFTHIFRRTSGLQVHHLSFCLTYMSFAFSLWTLRDHSVPHWSLLLQHVSVVSRGLAWGNWVGVFSLESLVLFCSGKFSSVVFPLSVMCVIWTESSVLLFVECPQLSFINLLCLSFWVVVL